jgi:hypothetical protein
MQNNTTPQLKLTSLSLKLSDIRIYLRLVLLRFVLPPPMTPLPVAFVLAAESKYAITCDDGGAFLSKRQYLSRDLGRSALDSLSNQRGVQSNVLCQPIGTFCYRLFPSESLRLIGDKTLGTVAVCRYNAALMPASCFFS